MRNPYLPIFRFLVQNKFLLTGVRGVEKIVSPVTIFAGLQDLAVVTDPGEETEKMVKTAHRELSGLKVHKGP